MCKISQIYFGMKLYTRFGQFLCPSSGVYLLYTRHWYVSYRFEDSFRTGPGWNVVSCQNKFEKLLRLVGFLL
jgi:hypothetical protein